MHRLETSTVQVNAALDYCRENKVNIFVPVRMINRAFIGKMSQKPREKKSIRIKVRDNAKKHSVTAKDFFKKVKENFLSRLA